MQSCQEPSPAGDDSRPRARFDPGLTRQDTASQLVAAAKRAEALQRQDTNGLVAGVRAVTGRPATRRPPANLLSATTTDNLLSFQGTGLGGEKSREAVEKAQLDFKEEVLSVRKKLRQHGRTTLNPRSTFVKIWDFALVSALTFTTFVTPFEVAFSEGEAPVRFVFNRTVDVIFAFDVLIAFFMPYKNSMDLGGAWVYDRKKIVRHYLRTFFVPDVLTCIPFDIIVAALRSDESADSSQLRLLRMVRILKVTRVVRASRIVQRWQDHVAVSYATSALLKFALMLLILAHWLACFWGLVGQAGGDGVAANSVDADRRLADTAKETVTFVEWSGRYAEGLTWIQKYQLQELGAIDTYGVALYVALNNIFGGSCEINPANPSEFYAQGVMLFIGSAVWAYVIGSACGIIATLDPAKIEYRQTMDELNFFCRDQSLPASLRVDLRAYFRNTLYQIRSKRYDGLLGRMSMKLRGDAAFRMCEFRLRQVPYLVHPDLESEFMSNLAIKCTISVYSTLERVPCMRLLIVDRGIVAKRGRLGLAGASFGADVILSNINLRDIGDAIALTFVQSTELSQDDIFELLPEYPRAYHVVRRAALQLALVRTLTKAARIVHRFKARGASPDTAVVDAIAAGDDGIARALETALCEPMHPHENSSTTDKSKTPFFPVSLKSRTLRSFKRRRNSWAPAGDGDGTGLWSKRPNITKVPTNEERLIALQTRVDETHGHVLKRLSTLEEMMTKLLSAGQNGSFNQKPRRRSLAQAPSRSNVLRAPERDASRERGRAHAGEPSREGPHHPSDVTAAERAELREEARLDEPKSSVSSPFEA